MKTAEQYSYISLYAAIAQVVTMTLAWIAPDPYDWFFVYASLTSGGVAVWALLAESKAKKQVPAPGFENEEKIDA